MKSSMLTIGMHLPSRGGEKPMMLTRIWAVCSTWFCIAWPAGCLVGGSPGSGRSQKRKCWRRCFACSILVGARKTNNVPQGFEFVMLVLVVIGHKKQKPLIPRYQLDNISGGQTELQRLRTQCITWGLGCLCWQWW